MLVLYLKNYRYRQRPIVIMLLVLIALLIGNTAINRSTVNKAYDILNSYNFYSFNYGYELSRESGLTNEVIYPDTDILFYKDCKKNCKIITSSIMKKEGNPSNYLNIVDLNVLKKSNEVIVPQNIADNYDLQIGDYIYCEYFYSNDLIQSKIVDILNFSLYDFSENAIENNVGLIILSYQEEYVKSTYCKYILLSEQSASNELSKTNCIINRTFIKANYEKDSYKMLIVPSLLTLTFFMIVGFIYILFSKKTTSDLKILVSKGLKMKLAKLWHILESLAIFLVPSFGVCLVSGLIFSTMNSIFIWMNGIVLLFVYSTIFLIQQIRFGNRR